MSGSRRLTTRDYSSPGLYFVTICANFKRNIFGKVVNRSVERSALGQIVEEAWLAVERRSHNVKSHCHVVMPSHVHGILEILPVQTGIQSTETRFPALSLIVRSFKSEVSRRAHDEINWHDEIWQHNYFDRVIRCGEEFENAMRYILENPARWEGQRKQWAESKRLKQDAQQAAPLQDFRAR